MVQISIASFTEIDIDIDTWTSTLVVKVLLVVKVSLFWNGVRIFWEFFRFIRFVGMFQVILDFHVENHGDRGNVLEA